MVIVKFEIPYLTFFRVLPFFRCYVICHDDGQQTNEDCKSFIQTSYLYNMAANSPSITQHVSLVLSYTVLLDVETNTSYYVYT